jgi:hypothetical protein
MIQAFARDKATGVPLPRPDVRVYTVRTETDWHNIIG